MKQEKAMSSLILINDGAGVHQDCKVATYNQIQSLIDDKRYQVKYYSEARAIESIF